MSESSFQSYIITPEQLADALAKKGSSIASTTTRIVPICASWFLPNDPLHRTGQKVFRDQRLPNARFFDLDAVKSDDSPYPHMLPTAEKFAQVMQKMGVRRDDEVVIYDSKELGVFSAPRVGWTFKIFGHPSVHLLNNFRLWVDHGYPTETGDASEACESSQYPISQAHLERVVNFAEVKSIAQQYAEGEGDKLDGTQILDARSQGRWAGSAPEPRPGLSSGHIPGSLSVPLPDLLDQTTGALLSRENLRKAFREKGVDPGRPVISSCGTGVTAAVIDAALEEAGYGDPKLRRLYDGSWTEWAQRVSSAEGLIEKTAE